MTPIVTGQPAGCVYRGQVMHHRLRPVDHRFTYDVFSLFLDIDRLEELAARLRLLGLDRWAPMSFHNCDHGARDGSPLRAWVEARLAENGMAQSPARIMLLCMPRLWGYVFNPLSIYFCYSAEERLESIVYEVKNTFGGQHAYVLTRPKGDDDRAFSHGCDKQFYVSPFIDMQARYHFRLRPPGQRLTFAIRETDAEGTFFVASHTARRMALSDRALLRCLAFHSFTTAKVFVGIHYEALRLWLKGAPYFDRGSPPVEVAKSASEQQESVRPALVVGKDRAMIAPE